MTAPELNAELQNLIDARLDQIEQTLMRAQVSYSERRHVVGDVESQIFEMLARRSESPVLEDIEAVLESLDPAEAYVPDELRGKLDGAAVESAPRQPRGLRKSRLALASGILAVIVLLICGLSIAMQDPHDKVEATIWSAICAFVVSLLGAVSLARIILSSGRLHGLRSALFAAILFPIVAVNLLIWAALIATNGVIPWLLTGLGIAYLNYLAVRQIWRWLNARQEHLADALRHAFANEKVQENGIHTA